MMTTFERRQTILRLLKEQPGVKVARLAETLDVSEGTIRNDLTSLESDQKIQRVRGGAVLVEPPNTHSPLTLIDNILNAKTKRRIALEKGPRLICTAHVSPLAPFCTSIHSDQHQTSLSVCVCARARARVCVCVCMCVCGV